MILKVTQKQNFALYSGRIFFKINSWGLRRGFFLNETSILFFAKLAILYSI